MKKTFAILSILLLTSGLLKAIDLSLGFNLKYAYGTSAFFKTSTLQIPNNGVTDIQNDRSRLGLGFGFNLNVPLINHLFLQPAISVIYGYHQTEILPGGDASKATHENYYFWIISGDLNLAYEFLRLGNGWRSYVMTGIGINPLKPAAQLTFEKKNYVGWQAGIGFKFLEIKKWGFNTLCYYKTLFSGEKMSYVGIDCGIYYKF